MITIPISDETWLVCGGRDFADQAMFDDVMSEISQMRGLPRKLIEGGARGADRMAQLWAKRLAVPEIVTVPADWNAHGKSAGPIRNQKMLDEHKPRVVIAFPGGKGTADMVRRGLKTPGVDVIEVHPR